MVTPMIKYTFLLHHLSIEPFLKQLGDLGVVDVIVSGAEHNDYEKGLFEKINDIKSTSEKIVRFAAENKTLCDNYTGHKVESVTDAVSLFKSLQDDNEKLETKHSKYAAELREVSVWGHFDVTMFNKLEQNNIVLNFYITSTKDFNQEWFGHYNIEVIEEDINYTYFIVITRSDESIPELGGYQAIKRPKYDVKELENKITEIESLINVNKQQQAEIAGSLEQIDSYILEIEHTLKEELIKNGNNNVAEGMIYVVEGWVPKGKHDILDKEFENNEIIIFKNKPTLEDSPPILLKNNRFARLCEVIAKLYSMPSYHELDLTPFFAPFFIFFVGFCFGDLGYGLFVFTCALIASFIVKDKSIKPVLELVMWCCFSTMIMGGVTGIFFGIPLVNFDIFKNVPFVSPESMFSFSLFVGVVHILYAMFVKTYSRIKYYGFKYAVSTLSWIFTILVSIAAYILPEQGINFSFSSLSFKIIIGVLLLLNILFIDASKKNLLSNIGGGLWELYNSITGLLGDVLSYIRLFALGLTSGVLASVFNDLAVGLSPDIPVVKYLVMLIILLIGHGINIFMAMIGSFVHPLRLTFVEFYKNVGFEGGGKEYTPFKNEKNV